MSFEDTRKGTDRRRVTIKSQRDGTRVKIEDPVDIVAAVAAVARAAVTCPAAGSAILLMLMGLLMLVGLRWDCADADGNADAVGTVRAVVRMYYHCSVVAADADGTVDVSGCIFGTWKHRTADALTKRKQKKNLRLHAYACSWLTPHSPLIEVPRRTPLTPLDPCAPTPHEHVRSSPVIACSHVTPSLAMCYNLPNHFLIFL